MKSSTLSYVIHDYLIIAIVRKMGKALLVMHSPQDTTVGIDNAEQIYKAIFNSK